MKRNPLTRLQQEFVRNASALISPSSGIPRQSSSSQTVKAGVVTPEGEVLPCFTLGVTPLGTAALCYEDY